MKKLSDITLIVAVILILSCHQNSSNNLNASSSSNPGPAQLKKAAANKEASAVKISYDDIAKFISGLPCLSPSLKELQNTDAWKTYTYFIDSNWTDLETKRFEPIKTWADTELVEANKKTKILFYPFGGPDFLTACQFFPNADTYILLGLEHVGNLPEVEKWKPRYMESYLEDIRISLFDFFKRSYFITRDMSLSLQSDKLDGVLPLVCFFLERGGNNIMDIKRIEFDEKGNTLEVPYSTLMERTNKPYGIGINYFSNALRRSETVYYFSCDLSDQSFYKDSKFFLYLDKMEAMTAFIKSASYLLHYENFSNIRNMILAKSQFILQDDTGIPFRYFKEKNWEIHLYGQYAKPIKDFSGMEQQDLKAAYQDKNKIKRLPFHLGYHYGSNLDAWMFIKRK
jgi:hypothetical protein